MPWIPPNEFPLTVGHKRAPNEAVNLTRSRWRFKILGCPLEARRSSRASDIGRGAEVGVTDPFTMGYNEVAVMNTVIVSPEFQVVIPLAIRQSLSIQPGQTVQVIQYDNRVELIPVRSMAQARGLLHGIDTTLEREPDRV